MSAPHRCGHCGRPIIAGDAYQCTRCSTLFHATCWAGAPRCTCTSTTSRVVHVGPGGRVEITAPPPQRAAPDPMAGGFDMGQGGGYAGQRRPSQGGGSPPPSPHRSDPTGPGVDVELECPHCMLPIDSLDAPCPFCNRMPRFGGANVMVIEHDPHPSAPAPWGLQTISLIDRIGAVFCWFTAAMLLIPAFVEAEIGMLFVSAFFASMGYLSWRLGGDLLKRKAWARTTQTVFAVLQLFGFPIGTVMGSLYLWGLHSERAERFFDDRPLLPEK